MHKQRYGFITKKYEEFLDRITQLKIKKLKIIAKYRKMADEKRIEELRLKDKESHL